MAHLNGTPERGGELKEEQRARAVSLMADGRGADDVAALLGVSRRTVYRWREGELARRRGEVAPHLEPREPRPMVHRPAKPAAPPKAEQVALPGVDEAEDIAVGLTKAAEQARAILESNSSTPQAKNAASQMLERLDRRRRVLAAQEKQEDLYDFERLTDDELSVLTPLLEKARVK